jgi:hypothetical protein
MSLEKEVLEILDSSHMIAVKGGFEDRQEFNDQRTCSAKNNGKDCTVVNNSKTCVLINNSKETCSLVNTNKTCTVVKDPSV